MSLSSGCVSERNNSTSWWSGPSRHCHRHDTSRSLGTLGTRVAGGTAPRSTATASRRCWSPTGTSVQGRGWVQGQAGRSTAPRGDCWEEGPEPGMMRCMRGRLGRSQRETWRTSHTPPPTRAVATTGLTHTHPHPTLMMTTWRGRTRTSRPPTGGTAPAAAQPSSADTTTQADMVTTTQGDMVMMIQEGMVIMTQPEGMVTTTQGDTATITTGPARIRIITTT